MGSSPKNEGTPVAATPAAGAAAGRTTEAISLVLLDSKRIADASAGLTEPSGLALSHDGRQLWTVSDDTKRVFALGLDGELEPDRSFRIDARGLEGVVADPAGDRLLAVKEESAEILVIDIGKERIVATVPLSRMAGYGSIRSAFEAGPANKGLEGITLDPATGAVFVLKEGAPRLLIELSPDLSVIRDTHALTAEAGFVADDVPDSRLDVSDVVYDPVRRGFWILSDVGRRVFLYDPKTRIARGAPLTWSRDGARQEIGRAEGVAVDRGSTRLFIVTDDGKQSRLFTFSIHASGRD